MTRKTLVVDGNNIAMRSIKAAERKEMSAGDQPTGGLHFFILTLSRYIRETNPDSVVVCWDGGRSTFRSQLYPAYKAARAEQQEMSKSQFKLMKEFLTLANIHHVQHQGVEGDDLVAAYWRRKASDEQIVILSGDKDFLQLLDGWTEQIRPAGGLDPNERWTANRVRSEMGCTPEQVPLLMALMGDIGDGIPGVPGYGPKKALKALAQYGWDLDALLAGEPKLFNFRDDVRTFLRLVSLREGDVTVPEPPSFKPTTPASVMGNDLKRFFDIYQLRSHRAHWVEGSLWSQRRGDGEDEGVRVRFVPPVDERGRADKEARHV
jgi:5'-3' exonuclease